VTEHTATLRERRAEKRRQEILAAALEVLAEDGYGQASMDNIAERALLTRMGLYKHFRDKPTLMAALRQQKLAELAERVRVAVANHHHPAEQLRLVLRETVAYQRDNTGFFSVLLASSFSRELVADTSLKPYIYLLAGLLTRGMSEGVFVQADPIACASLITTMAFEPTLRQAFVPGEVPGEHASVQPNAELMAKLVLGGLLV
jgi:AcrR family transcriptional regulator